MSASPHGREPNHSGPVQLPVLLDELMAHYDSIGAEKTTKAQSRRAFAEFMKRTGARTVEDLDDDHIRRFVPNEGESPQSYWGLMRSIRAGCKHAVGLGLISTTPAFPNIPQPAEIAMTIPVLIATGNTSEEIGLFFSYLRDRSDDWEVGRLEMLCALVLHGQLLPGREANRVMWCHLVDGMIEVPRRATMSRSASPIWIPISAPLQAYLDRWEPSCGSDYVVPNKSRTGFWSGGSYGQKAIEQVKAVGRAIGINITLQSIYEYSKRYAVPTVILPMLATSNAPTARSIPTIATNQAQAPSPTVKPAFPDHPRMPLDTARLTRLMAQLLRESGSWEGCRLYTLAMTVLFRGYGKRTAIQLPVEACDLESGMISPPGRGLAGPIAPELAKALRRWLEILGPSGSPDLFPGIEFRGPWIGGSPGKKAGDKLRQAAIRAGVGPVTFDDLTRYKSANGGRVELEPWFYGVEPPPFDGKAPTRGRSGPARSPDAASRRKLPRAIFGPPPARSSDSPASRVLASASVGRAQDPVPWRGTREQLTREIDAIESEATRDVVGKLIELMPTRPTEKALEKESKHGDAVNLLRRLSRTGCRLGQALGFPGKGKPGYWIAIEVDQANST